MTANIAVAIVLGVAVWAGLNRGHATPWFAVVCVLFGLTLGGTPIGDWLEWLLTTLAEVVWRWVSSLAGTR